MAPIWSGVERLGGGGPLHRGWLRTGKPNGNAGFPSAKSRRACQTRKGHTGGEAGHCTSAPQLGSRAGDRSSSRGSSGPPGSRSSSTPTFPQPGSCATSPARPWHGRHRSGRYACSAVQRPGAGRVVSWRSPASGSATLASVDDRHAPASSGSQHRKNCASPRVCSVGGRRPRTPDKGRRVRLGGSGAALLGPPDTRVGSGTIEPADRRRRLSSAGSVFGVLKDPFPPPWGTIGWLARLSHLAAQDSAERRIYLTRGRQKPGVERRVRLGGGSPLHRVTSYASAAIVTAVTN